MAGTITDTLICVIRQVKDPISLRPSKTISVADSRTGERNSAKIGRKRLVLRVPSPRKRDTALVQSRRCSNLLQTVVKAIKRLGRSDYESLPPTINQGEVDMPILR